MSLAWEKPCQRFSFDAIQRATDDFDESKVIGRGGFGKVYKGLVGDDGSATTVVAVKRLNPESKQGVGEFQTEIKMLSKFRHCHLVCLVGYCDEDPEMILVYEYMSHGTLADHLYRNQDSPLTWEQRLNICIGAARGLDYLHTGTGLKDRVIHLDVKSDNILLDDNWAAKIADLGLSRTGPANQLFSEVVTDHIRGTRGYIDPRYRKSHKFSRKADVYAFGVVLLEVLSGTRAMGGEIIPQSELVDLANWTEQHIRNGTLNQIVDPCVIREIEPRCLRVFADTAGKSLHSNPKKRPTMSEVVAQLECAWAFQTRTNSSSIIDDDLLQHFNGAHIESGSQTISEHVSTDEEESSEHHGVVAEPEPEASIDSEDSAIWSSMGMSMADYLGMAHNIFGEPIRNQTMVRMGLNPTRENKAKIAYSMMNQGNKYDHALRFVKDLKAQWGNGITALCLLYNATGETLTYAASRNWFGDIGPSPYPTIILNGQWGAYLHTKTPKVPSGSAAAVVYRGKYADNAFCDRMLAWSIPWQRFTQDNVAYCEINEVGHFDGAVWNSIYSKIPFSGRLSSAVWNDCYTKVTVESDTSPIYKAILTHVDAVTASV